MLRRRSSGFNPSQRLFKFERGFVEKVILLVEIRALLFDQKRAEFRGGVGTVRDAADGAFDLVWITMLHVES